MGKSCGLPSGERAIPCLVAAPSSASLAASGVMAYLFPPHIRLFPGIRYSYVRGHYCGACERENKVCNLTVTYINF